MSGCHVTIEEKGLDYIFYRLKELSELVDIYQGKKVSIDPPKVQCPMCNGSGEFVDNGIL